MYDFLADTRNYSIFLAFIASSFSVTEEDLLSETDLSGPHSFLNVFTALKGTHLYIFICTNVTSTAIS